jgi:hypothetical protein
MISSQSQCHYALETDHVAGASDSVNDIAGARGLGVRTELSQQKAARCSNAAPSSTQVGETANARDATILDSLERNRG